MPTIAPKGPLSPNCQLARLKTSFRSRLSECCEQFAQKMRTHMLTVAKARLSECEVLQALPETKEIPVAEPKPVPVDNGERVLYCEMPLSDRRKSCRDCDEMGHVMNCPQFAHMPLCRSDEIFLICGYCNRVLCGRHSMMKKCYCARRLKEKKKELESRSQKKPAKPSMPKPASSSSSTKPVTAKPRSNQIPLADDSGGWRQPPDRLHSRGSREASSV